MLVYVTKQPMFSFTFLVLLVVLPTPLSIVGASDATAPDTCESGSNWVSIAKAPNQGPEASFCKTREAERSQAKPSHDVSHCIPLVIMFCGKPQHAGESEQFSTRYPELTSQNNLGNLW